MSTINDTEIAKQNAKDQAEQQRQAIGRKLRGLRLAAGMSQQKVADLSGLSQAEINRFELGQRKMSVEHATKIAQTFRIPPAELLPANFLTLAAPAVVPAPLASATMHILSGAGEPIEETPVPPVLATARERYALYMPDSSMAPRYAAGTLLHVAPHKPPAPGRGIIVTLTDGKRLVREYVGSEPQYLQVKRYGADPGTENHPADTVLSVHVIVGTVES